MEFFTLLLLYLTVGSSCFYLIMCADPNKTGVASLLHRLIYIRLPKVFTELAPRIIGTRGLHYIITFLNYICYKNHPIIQIMYLIIVIGGFALYMIKGFGEHFPNRRLSSNHVYSAFVGFFFCLWAYYKTCSVKPGIITSKNNKQYLKQYNKYDGYLFLENNTCKTCEIIKPARSKHCRVCDVCVAKFDHHCVWVRQCIGEQNYKYFLLFILSHCLLCLYGTYVGGIVFYGITKDNHLLELNYKMGGTGEVVSGSYFIVFQYLFHRYTAFFFITVLCLVMGVTLALFFLYHCSMISGGTSTNERIKKSDIAHALKNELKLLDQKLEINKDNEAMKKALLKEKKELTAEYEKIENYFQKGFMRNIKQIFAQK